MASAMSGIRLRLPLRAKEKPAQLAEIALTTADALLAFDSGMRVRFCNAAAQALFGYSENEFAGMPLDRLLPQGLRSVHEEHVRTFNTSGASARFMADRRSVEGLRRDGTIIPLRISILKHRRPGPLAVTAILRDISNFVAREEALRDALARAQAADIAKSQFLANVTHELKTPLNAVIGFAELLAGHTKVELAREQIAEFARYISESGHHLLDLLEELILAARLEAERIVPDADEVDLAALAVQTIASIEPAMASAGIVLAPADLPDSMPLEGDGPLLRQALGHILRNAVRYCPHHTTIWLSAEAGEDAVALAIADDGPGMDTEALRSAGEPFFQIGDTLTRRSGGLGLGLFIARRICELHGGALVLESTPGAGTRVTLSLPRVRMRENRHHIENRGIS